MTTSTTDRLVNRTLGSGDAALTVSLLGLGCMGMSEFYGTSDESEAVATIHRALDLGVTLLDTADMYGPFTNERLVAGRSPTAVSANLAIVDVVRTIAEAKGATSAQVALAWVLAQGEDVVPIPGTKRLRYLEENVGAAAVTLTPAERQQLDRALPEPIGDRYADMSSIDA